MNRTLPTMTPEEVEKWRREMALARLFPPCPPPKQEKKHRDTTLSCGICWHSLHGHSRTTCRRCECPGFIMSPEGIRDYVRTFHLCEEIRKQEALL